ncbi:MAG: hypothetical protein HYS61_04230, partial [Acidobacteria bacterium]|nr:hypothetical protein [Acidobacteriota bacterium]
MKERIAKPAFPAVLGILVCVSACNVGNLPVGELQTESKSVELGDAKSVRVEIKMGAGELKVAGGARQLLDADFAYNVARWQP